MNILKILKYKDLNINPVHPIKNMLNQKKKKKIIKKKKKKKIIIIIIIKLYKDI